MTTIHLINSPIPFKACAGGVCVPGCRKSAIKRFAAMQGAIVLVGSLEPSPACWRGNISPPEQGSSLREWDRAGGGQKTCMDQYGHGTGLRAQSYSSHPNVTSANAGAPTDPPAFVLVPFGLMPAAAAVQRRRTEVLQDSSSAC